MVFGQLERTLILVLRPSNTGGTTHPTSVLSRRGRTLLNGIYADVRAIPMAHTNEGHCRLPAGAELQRREHSASAVEG